MAFQELKRLAREHRPKIKGFSHMSKADLLDILLAKELISQDDMNRYSQIDYDWLKNIRNKPISVEILDNETGVKTVHQSLYSAGKAYGVNARAISTYDGKVWRQRFEIKCLAS